MDTTSIILKTDSRGRVRMPPQRREELLLEFECSELLLEKFSRTGRDVLLRNLCPKRGWDPARMR